jgi:hypothetical protein
MTAKTRSQSNIVCAQIALVVAASLVGSVCACHTRLARFALIGVVWHCLACLCGAGRCLARRCQAWRVSVWHGSATQGLARV